MRIRIEGDRDEVLDAADTLRGAFDVHGTSRLCPNRRSPGYRIYVDARARQPETTQPTTSHRQEGPPTDAR